MKRITFYLMLVLHFVLLTKTSVAQQVPYTFSINRLPSNGAKYQIFYNFLRGQGYPNSMLGTVSDFEKKIKKRDHAIRLYRGLKKDGYREDAIGTEAEFIKKFCE